MHRPAAIRVTHRAYSSGDADADVGVSVGVAFDVDARDGDGEAAGVRLGFGVGLGSSEDRLVGAGIFEGTTTDAGTGRTTR
jgi:hypothetical protein